MKTFFKWGARIAPLLPLFAALFFAPQVRSADVPVYPIGGTYTISSSLGWGISTGTGFNQNFFFTPAFSNGSVCVYVFNNNPTSAHTYSGSITSSGNASEKTPSDGTWQNVLPSVTQTLGASPSAPGVFGGTVNGAALINISFSGSTVQAGSPDTATVVLIQTSGTCLTNNPQQAGFIQPGTPFTTEAVSGVASAATITQAVTSTFGRVVVFSISGRCSAGTAQLTISANGTQVWSSAAADVTTTTFRFQWNPGLTMGAGVTPITFTISSCGAGNTGTMDLQYSVVVAQ